MLNSEHANQVTTGEDPGNEAETSYLFICYATSHKSLNSFGLLVNKVLLLPLDKINQANAFISVEQKFPKINHSNLRISANIDHPFSPNHPR